MTSDAVEVRNGEELEQGALAAHLRSHLAGLEGDLTVLQFPNGAANLTYLLTFGTRELVLRRPPFGHIAPGAHDMRREYRVLSQLWRCYGRAPKALLFCDDSALLGADFFVMERRTGEVIRDTIPPSMSHHVDVARRIGLAVVDAMAELHAIDPTACHLEDLGKPDGFVARQIKGWRNRWEMARPDDAPPLMDELPDLLEQSRPPTRRSSIIHNDLKLDNCQFDASDPDTVTSVFDWDMATLGDPMIDLGTLLNYWPDPADPPGTWRATHPGMVKMGLPPRAEVVERYAEKTGEEVANVAWYEAFAQWKTAVVVQQLHNRYLRGETKDQRMADMGARVAVLAHTASVILSS